MPIAYSQSDIIYRTFADTSASTIIDGLVNALAAAHWNAITAITNGYSLVAISPQGLQVRLFIESLGHRLNPSYNTTVSLRLETVDSIYSGQYQELEIGTGHTYQAIAGICQLATSQIGIAGAPGGSNYIGGIPFVHSAAACGGEIPTESANQCFWSMGDFGGLGAAPRFTLITANDQENCEALWNTVYQAGGIRSASLRIAAYTVAPQIFQGFNYPSRIRWFYGGLDQSLADYLAYEPLLCWGGPPVQARAQIWDALVFSVQEAMDLDRDFYTFRWKNWTNNYLYGGLYLMKEALPGVVGTLHNHAAIAI